MRMLRDHGRVWAVLAFGAACAPVLAAETEALFETAGRTHPALVHFPIALIAAAFLFELVRIVGRRDRPSTAALGCLFIAAAGAALATTTGWWHADFDGRTGEEQVELHRWVAIVGGSLAVLALMLGLTALGGDRRMLRRLYVLVVAVAAGTITVAGHQGGELVYGEGYVFEPLFGGDEATEPAGPVLVVADLPAAQDVSFERDLLPVFRAACIECHGADKQNGKLRLDSIEALRSSPYFDEVIVAGDADRSTLYERITLPQTDRDFMPKRGEPLAARDVAAIRRWIEGQTAGLDAASSTDIDQPAEEPTGEARVARAEQVIAAVAARGGHAAFESAQNDRLVVNLSVLSRPMTREDLTALEPAADAVIELNLGGAGVTDALVPDLVRFAGIERLNLSRSDIKDSSIAALGPLGRLRVLNLYGSSVTNAAVDAIAALPGLERVYIWRTFIDATGVQRLQTLRPGLQVIVGAEAPLPEAPAEVSAPEPPDGVGAAGGD